MKRISIVLALVCILVLGGMVSADAAGKGDFLVTDVSTFSVLGFAATVPSSYTFTGATNPLVKGKIGLEKLILTNGTTQPYRIDVYTWGTPSASTATVSRRISVQLTPAATTGATADINFPYTNRPIINYILIRKLGTSLLWTGPLDAGITGEVTAYGLYR